MLAALAASELAHSSAPLEQPSITVRTQDPDSGLERLDTGLTVRVRIQDEFVQVDDMFRIGAMVVTVGEEGQESVTLSLDARIGARWRPAPTPFSRIRELEQRVARLERKD